MATEVTAQSHWSGRLPSVGGASKVPGPGLKIKKVRFTTGTSEYPAGGFTAADLEALLGLTRISHIQDCFGQNGSTPFMVFGIHWDDVNRKLVVVGNSDADLAGNATAGTNGVGVEIGTNLAAADSMVFTTLVIGY